MVELTLADHILLINSNGLDTVRRLTRELRADPATRGKSVVLVDETLAELPLELADLGVIDVPDGGGEDVVDADAQRQAQLLLVILACGPAGRFRLITVCRPLKANI